MTASNKSSQRLTKEEYPEPKTKAGFPALIREILDQPGGVERIQMERGQPVRVWRWIQSGDLMEDDPTLDQALSGASVVEYVNPDPEMTAAEALFHMFAVLKSERLFPVCWAAGRDHSGLLRKWLRVDEQAVPFVGTDILGVPLERLKSLPEDTLLLCGAEHVGASMGDVTFAIKVAMEWRDAEEKVVDGHAIGGGDLAQERGGPAGEASNGATRHRRSDWFPPSFIRGRLGKS